MSKESDIEWCDGTVNCTTGCEGCELATPGKPEDATCYAKHYHEGRMASVLPLLYAKDFHEVRLVPGRMAKAAAWSDLRGTNRPGKPWLSGMPRTIFVGDMGDVFSKEVPFDFLKRELYDTAVSAKGSRHIWMVLTKQAKRAAEFSDWLMDQGINWPQNIWVGTSITRQATTARLDDLRRVGGESTTRYVSAEPLLGEVNFKNLAGFQLCIAGGESGTGARPCDLQWIRSIVAQCKAADVPCFVKQLGARPFDSSRSDIWFDGKLRHQNVPDDGEKAAYARTVLGSELQPAWVKLKDRKGGDMMEWAEDLRVRQFPALAPTP